ncbi:MAG: PEP/pyruvate-binding domain-containing protein [Syntrophobacteraceae bacterium]
MLKFLDIFRKGRAFQPDSAEKALFQKKYQHFQNLLAGNNQALELITDLELACYGSKPFSLDYVIHRVERLMAHVYDIAEDLDALSGGKYPSLPEAVERIGHSIFRELIRKKTVEKTNLTIPLRQVSLERLSEVGGKAANIGEISNRVHLPVPRGFAVSAYAYDYFMESNGLYKQAKRILKGLDIDDTARLLQCSTQIQDLILNAPLPPVLEESLLREMDALIAALGPGIRVAVRSSATSEDSEASFAGQHSSVLGIDREGLLQAYKTVLASTYNPRAVYYRRSKGYPDEYVIMSVLCLVMIEAEASGVLYTRDPNDPRRNMMLINAVWGLGLNAVDGSVPTDFYEVDRAGRRLFAARAAVKQTKLVVGPGGELIDETVPEDLRRTPCLGEAEIKTLVDYGFILEEHFRLPQDVEWAMDREGKIVIVQSRPLNINLDAVQDPAAQDSNGLRDGLPGHPVLLQGGSTASRGKASGIAYVLNSEHNLLNIPEGSILVAKQTSPRYVALLGRVQAIITDVGSVTGHMASVAREFGVPTLAETGNATQVIPHGEEITLDATNRVVFKGRVESILERKRPVNPMKGSPAYKAAHAALKKIAVLNLLDPESETFSPEGCQTFHDVIRFAHEKSMREMFRISDDIELSKHSAIRIRVPLPMKILAVDLGGGLDLADGAAEAAPDAVTSKPFKALLTGMTNPNVRWFGPVDVDWKGFASILSESLFKDPVMEDRMGGPSYVVLSEGYLNFNSRLGYHFTVVDAYCGSHVNDNYLLFSFKGGAADIGRRSRRAVLISKILKRLGFKVTLKGDFVRGEIKKYECDVLLEKLDMVGRLLGSVRLLDMVLSDEGRIDWYVDEFMNGNYTFSRG